MVRPNIKDIQFRGNVLVVEDVDGQRESMRRTLERKGFNVRGTKTGAYAIKVCQSSSIDFLILDHYLGAGQLDGIDVAEHLQKTNPEVDIIAYTAFGNVYRPQAEKRNVKNIRRWVDKGAGGIDRVVYACEELYSEKIKKQYMSLLDLGLIAEEQKLVFNSYSFTEKEELIQQMIKSLESLLDEEVGKDIQQSQIILSQIKQTINESFWFAFKTRSEYRRDLLHMIRSTSRQIKVPGFSTDQIQLFIKMIRLLSTRQVNNENEALRNIESELNRVGIDISFKVSSEIDELIQLYNSEDMFRSEGEQNGS